MKLSRKEKNSYWMPYTNNEWFKKKPRLLDSAKGMYYKTNSGEKIHPLFTLGKFQNTKLISAAVPA